MKYISSVENITPGFSERYSLPSSLPAEMSATNDLHNADPLIGLSPERRELLRRVSTEEGAHSYKYIQSFEHTTSSC